MLIKCPECELQVSDKAIICPHCGYPLKDVSKIKNISSTKRKRLPNGFGQISKINNRNLRKPYRAMITVGKDETGHPICKLLEPQAYFETYNDAYTALIEYNRNPYEISSITMKELYNEWIEEYKKTVGPESVNQSRRAWAYCSSIYNMKVVNIRVKHLKECLENGCVIKKGVRKTPTSRMKNLIKTNFNLMFDYALANEIITNNRARFFKLDSEIIEENRIHKGHINYSEEELELLWNNVDSCPGADIVLIQCYSGWRPKEMENISLDDVDLDNWTMHGGVKTEAGKNRVIPIHPRIRPLVKNLYDDAAKNGLEYLFHCDYKKKKNLRLTNHYFSIIVKSLIASLKISEEHKPHDGRVTFVTRAKKYKVDEYAIKYFVGHTINDITEKVYTKREKDWFESEMKKIK